MFKTSFDESIDQRNSERDYSSKIDKEINLKELQRLSDKKRKSTGYNLDLRKAFKHEKELKANQPTAPKFKFVIFLSFFSIYLIVSTLMTIKIDDSYRTTSKTRNFLKIGLTLQQMMYIRTFYLPMMSCYFTITFYILRSFLKKTKNILLL